MKPDLTTRQIQVLALYASGYTSVEISGILFLSHHTVENYRKAAKKKAGARSLPQLVAWAVSSGVLKVTSDGSVVANKED